MVSLPDTTGCVLSDHSPHCFSSPLPREQEDPSLLSQNPLPQSMAGRWLMGIETACSQQVKRVLLHSWKQSTCRTHSQKWTRCANWCDLELVTPTTSSVQGTLDYILELRSLGLLAELHSSSSDSRQGLPFSNRGLLYLPAQWQWGSLCLPELSLPEEPATFWLPYWRLMGSRGANNFDFFKVDSLPEELRARTLEDLWEESWGFLWDALDECGSEREEAADLLRDQRTRGTPGLGQRLDTARSPP